MRKYLNTTLVLLISNLAFGQSIVSDSVLLRIIYGKVDNDGKTSTIEYLNNEFKQNKDDKLSFKIIFKGYFVLNNSNALYVICQAPSSFMQGHQFGFTESYYLKKQSGIWKVLQRNIDKEPNPIGDDQEIKVEKIGIDKSALFSTFSSTGNHHLQRSISISHISNSGLKYIGEIDLDYSNEAWIDLNADSSSECKAFGYQSDYKIIESSKEWFDIKVIKRSKTFTKGCKEEIVNTNEILYTNKGVGYKEIK